MRHHGAVAVVWAVLAASGGTARADAIEDCAQARDLEMRVKACTQIISGAGFADDKKAAAYRHRGLARADAGARDAAIADLGEAIRLNGGDAAAYAGRATARLAKGEIDAAIMDFSAALRLSPRAVPTLIGRGHAYLVKGNADGAIADFSEALRIDPKSASALNNRGLAHRKKGDIDRAIDDYTAAINLNPIYALAYNNRGYAYEAKGMKVEAIADFGRALTLDRGLVGASEGLKRLKATGELQGQSERLVAEGKALVESNCARCHAVGSSGTSPNPKAPQFRQLQQRHPVRALREPLSRGIAAPHDEMPKFKLADAEIDKIIAYINSLPAPDTAKSQVGKK